MSATYFVKIAIVGQGSIGRWLAIRAHTLGINCHLLTRSGERFSLRYQTLQGQQSSFSPNVQPISEKSAADVIVLPVKAYQVEDVVKQLGKHIQPHQVLMLLHNGMGTIELCQQLLPQQPLIAATTSNGAYIDQNDNLIEAGHGRSDAGWIHTANTPVPIQNTLTELLTPCYWPRPIESALWLKLAANAVINPLTALHQIPNGKLTDQKYTHIKQQLCAETTLVMQKLGYATTRDQLITRVNDIIRETADNHSSMKQDIALNRPTEIDFINGYIVHQAQRLGVQTPLHQKLWQQVRQRQRDSR